MYTYGEYVRRVLAGAYVQEQAFGVAAGGTQVEVRRSSPDRVLREVVLSLRTYLYGAVPFVPDCCSPGV